MSKVKDAVHSFLNEPEMVKILDWIEAILYLIFAFSMTLAYLLERTGYSKAAVTAVITSISAFSTLGLIFILRRPINRENRGDV